MSETAEHMAYVGYCGTCGGMIAAQVDDPQFRRDTAKFVAEMVREGSRVERVTCQHVRDTLNGCTPDCTCEWCVRKAKKAAKSAVVTEGGP